MELQEKLREAECQVDSFEKMLNGADRLTQSASKPWKWAVAALAAVVLICVSGWVITSNRHMNTIDKLTDQIIQLQEQQG